jgi:hypothetical protein
MTAHNYDTLRDSDTNESLTAEELGITDEQYAEAIEESATCSQAEGHVLVNGRRVYAQ